MNAEQLARLFHNTYEELAPVYGWETQLESRTAWEDVPERNKKLMVATAERVLARIEPLEAALRALGTLGDEEWRDPNNPVHGFASLTTVHSLANAALAAWEVDP